MREGNKVDKRQLEELAIAERRAYHRAWRAANRDKVRAQNAAYWRKRAEKKLHEKEDANSGK